MASHPGPSSSPGAREDLQLQLLQGLAVGVFGLDLEGRFTFLNPAACRMLGFADERDAIGHHAHQACHDRKADGSEFPERECPIYRVQRTGRTLRAWEDWFWRQDGSGFPVRVYASPLYGSDQQLQGLVVSFQDLTEQVEMSRRRELAQQAAGIGIWEYYPGEDRIVWDAGSWRIVGEAPAGAEPFTYRCWRARVQPDDLGHVEPRLRAHMQTGEPFELELRYWHTQQGWVWVQARGQAVEWYDDGTPRRLMGTHVDIHRLKETELALRQREQEFTEAKQVARLGNWVSDFTRNHIKWSDEIYEIFGLSPDEWQATHEAFMQAVHPEDRAKVQAALDASIRDGAEYEVEHRVLRPDGTVATVQEIGRTIHDADGNALRMVGTVQDVTELRALREANRAKSQFLNAVSHDLRTPLNTVIGFADLLAQTPLDDEQRQYLELCQGGARRLNELIDTLLELARLERGNLSLSKEVFSLRRCVQELETLLSLQAEAGRLELSFAVDPRLPEWVYGDRIRFTQVIQNLVTNALKFCREGSVQVTLEPSRQDAYVTVAVADTGPGIAPEDREAIFESFRQSGDGTLRRQGSGLGLAISSELVHLMGGAIELDSEVGVGSTFRFCVYLPPAATPPAGADGREEPAVDAPAAPADVLVADDEPVNAMLLRTMLEGLGCRVEIAEDGREALRRWEAEAPDLLMLDLQMPAMGGLEVMARIRELEREHGWERTPAILCTANTADEIVRQSADYGFDELLSKPFRREALAAALACRAARSRAR